MSSLERLSKSLSATKTYLHLSSRSRKLKNSKPNSKICHLPSGKLESSKQCQFFYQHFSMPHKTQPNILRARLALSLHRSVPKPSSNNLKKLLTQISPTLNTMSPRPRMNRMHC